MPFSGLSAFPVTPTDGSGGVDTDHLQRLTRRLIRDGISSIGVIGSTGGYMYLSAEERARAISAAVEASGDTPVIAGIGDMRSDLVIAHAVAAKRAGANGLLLAAVRYLPLTDDEVFGLFQDVAAATDLPILIYNNPGTTGTTMSEGLITRLAGIDGVDAVKNPPAPEGEFAIQISRFRIETPEGFSLGYSGDAAILGALRAGADAWYSVLAGTLPEPCVALWKARKDPAALARAAEPLVPLLRCFDAYGGIRVVHEMTDMLGLGPVRLPKPLLPLGSDARREIETALEAALSVSETA